MFAKDIVPVAVMVPPLNPVPVATLVTPCTSSTQSGLPLPSVFSNWLALPSVAAKSGCKWQPRYVRALNGDAMAACSHIQFNRAGIGVSVDLNQPGAVWLKMTLPLLVLVVIVRACTSKSPPN